MEEFRHLTYLEKIEYKIELFKRLKKELEKCLEILEKERQKEIDKIDRKM